MCRRRFRLHEDELSVDPLQGLADREGAGVEIDIVPREPQELTLSETGADGSQVERLETVPFDGAEERPDLAGIEWMDRAPGHARRLGELGHVARHKPPALGLPERLSGDGSDVGDAARGRPASDFALMKACIRIGESLTRGRCPSPGCRCVVTMWL